MTIQRPGNLENLKAAAAARTAAAATRADTGLREMLRTGQPITFRGLARHAGVSLDFLYSDTALRQRIQQLRDQQRTQPGAISRHDATGGDPAGTAETTSSVVATLTAQLTDLRRRHREETAQLRRELEAAHGENLLLRRRLIAGHEPE
jgi:Family of unknown function (DUF6262)